MPDVTPQLVQDHGLTADEFSRIVDALGRQPTLTELGVFSVMWSEHCSYKSSKVFLRTLPTEALWVINGPGENAGVVDIGDGQAIIFKMESHNHPSYIEPYQGAATGVGGILRDVFTMGARPIASLNSLRFGHPDHPKTRHLVAGVVAGIGGYGNCVGVPTVGGECTFHGAYDGNILVNAMAVGLAATDRIFYSAAAGVGSPIVYVGSKTGRDGIHGATMASAEFSEGTEEKRPTVQIGDPFTEKLLIEACLELMETDAIIAVQDMGAAGLTSSSVEMASKGGVGVDLDLDAVPTRETDMTAYEIMLSESQERMLMVLRPERRAEAQAVFSKWGLDFAVVGTITDTNRMVIRHRGACVADLPLEPLASGAPEYRRPQAPPAAPAALSLESVGPCEDPLAALQRLLSCPDLASKRWIWEQYDHMVMTGTVQRPGGDAAVVRIDDTGKAVALSCDCTPRYCFADPREGGRQAVAETWRNLNAVGATPLAVTDCLNFGNPEKPAITGQFADCVAGIGDACRHLAFPVVSGNVSFYNETNGVAILPTPTIGGVGVLRDVRRMATPALKPTDDVLFVVGQDGRAGWLGQSLYLREVEGREAGAPPPVDLERERRVGAFVRGLIEAGRIQTCHDVSDGGLLVAVAEMALAGGIGVAMIAPDGDNACLRSPGWLFGEDQGRYIVAAPAGQAEQVADRAAEQGFDIINLGAIGGDQLTLGNGRAISLTRLKAVHEHWLPSYMATATSTG
jgi:phosphoribosylformylglycinamidine synthase subunit PurL